MKSYPIPCGKNTISLKIPDAIPVQGVESRKIAPVPDVRRAVEEALYRPIGTPRLRDLVRPGQTVALVVTDISRKLPQEIILPLLLKELAAGGIRKKDIRAVVAAGTHRPNTLEELKEKFGEVLHEISFVNNDAWNPGNLIHFLIFYGLNPASLLLDPCQTFGAILFVVGIRLPVDR